MSNPSLYDEDILLWSEQQAAAIRRLGGRSREIPNDLDIENVAEEIESVGRSELAAVESHLALILEHLIKLLVASEAEPVRHWRGEILGFHSRMRRQYSPSMRQRINVDELWRQTREQSMETYGGAQRNLIVSLSTRSPFELDDLIVERIKIDALLDRLRPAANPRKD